MSISLKNFIEEVQKNINLMNGDELREWILNLAHQIDDEKREEFLKFFTKETECEELIKKEEVIAFCDKINVGKLIIEYEYNHYDDDNECIDDNGIGGKLTKAFKLAQIMLYKKNYKDAFELYEKLCNLTIKTIENTSEDEEEQGINDLEYNNILDLNLKEVFSNYIYAEYMVTDKEKRPKQICETFCNIIKKVTLEDMISAGPEKLPYLEEFLTSLIEMLKNQNGMRTSELLREAVIYKDGVSGLSELADELYDKFPESYLDLCNILYEDKEYEQLINSAIKGTQKIDENLIIRSDIAEFMLKAAQNINDEEIVHKGMVIAFESNPTINNFLRLFYIPNNKEILNRTIDRAKEVAKNSYGTYFSYEERFNRKATITQDNYMLLELFNSNFDFVYEMFSNPKRKNRWSGNLKQIIAMLFMIIIINNKEVSKNVDKEVLLIVKNIGYFNQEEEQTFMEHFKQCLKTLKFTNEECEKYFNWSEKIIDEYIKEIVSNQRREEYDKAALLVVCLGNMYESFKNDCQTQIIMKYKNQFPRHRAFLHDLKEASLEFGVITGCLRI